jgi:hypothetical protein
LQQEGVQVHGRRVDLTEPPNLDALLWGGPGTGKMPRVQRGAKR